LSEAGDWLFLDDFLEVILGRVQNVNSLMFFRQIALRTPLRNILCLIKMLARWFKCALGTSSILHEISFHTECCVFELVDTLLF